MARLSPIQAGFSDRPRPRAGWSWPLILFAELGGMLLLALYGWYVAARIAQAWCFGC